MMFDDRSDYGVIVAGLFYLMIAALISGVFMLNAGLDLDLVGIGFNPLVLTALGVIGFILAGFMLYKGYNIEGISCGLAGLMVFGSFEYCFPLAIAILIGCLIAAFMGYHEGMLDMILFNIAFGVAAFITVGFHESYLYTVGGVLFVLAAGLMVYISTTNWMFAQDQLYDMESELFGDDGECCCDDDECDCDGECHCHDEEKE